MADIAPPSPWLWPWVGVLTVYSLALVWVLTTPQFRAPTNEGTALIPRQRCGEQDLERTR